MTKPSIEIADVFRAFWPAYTAQHTPLPSHRRAAEDIMTCMTEAMGGKRYQCDHCDKTFWAYHGCRNRACPKCHGRQTVEWLEKRSVECLPCEYFHVVATVPEELRPLFLAHQKVMYGLLMQSAAKALIELAKEKRFLGAEPAVMAVLHTWTSRLHYHPHVHMLVTGGGLSGDTWHEARSNFLVPVKRLSPMIRARFQEMLETKHPDLAATVSESVWRKAWCSHAEAKNGQSQDAVLNYLARYVFRIGITSNRILAMDETHVTFRYKENTTGTWLTERVTGEEFIRRFLLHVLPRGFHKVRYFGLWSPGKKQRLRLLALELALLKNQETVTIAALAEKALEKSGVENHAYLPTCPTCGTTEVQVMEQRRRRWQRYVT